MQCMFMHSFQVQVKLCFIATDGTAEAQMICFGDAGRRVVGKPVQQILRTRASDELPPDITGVVSLKFTFDIALTLQSYYRSDKQYQVNSVVTAHGRQCTVPVALGIGGAPSLNSGVAAIAGDETLAVPAVQPRDQAVAVSPVTLTDDPPSEELPPSKTPPPPDVI
ncbi:hypothetical protein BS78_02G159100 [Paspalum vaginatum]|nr:hypothetical protein BS78_02G159100 [Paspalum vaginatum]